MAVQGETFTKREICRACEGPNLVSVLDLGDQPLANGFIRPIENDGLEARYPLHLVRCLDCELLQLTVVVRPNILYGRHYAYRSGYSEGWALHCHTLAKEIGKQKRVLEIGCLDGVMLRHCSSNGCTVLGVDPSSPVHELPITRQFWNADIKLTQPAGYFDYIVAQNVFAHVDDAKGFLRAAKHYLSADGTLIIECPWVVDMIDGVQWDQVYHEHLSYWGLRSMMRITQAERLVVRDIKYFPDLHGGTMRYYISHPHKHKNVRLYERWRDEEMGEDDWKRFNLQASEQVRRWGDAFTAMKAANLLVAAYGASAKLNVFLNAMDEKPPLLCVLDDNPTKVGLLTPGWHIPVLEPTRERMQDLDTLLIGAANWKDEIEAKAKALGFKGEVRALWA